MVNTEEEKTGSSRATNQDGSVRKTSVAEWLFSDEYGQMATDVSMQEMEELYNNYI